MRLRPIQACSSIFSIALLLALSTANVSAAQDAPLTLEEALSQAQAQNPDLRRARAAEREASWKPLEAGSAYVPHLMITGSHLFDAKFQVLNVDQGGQITPFPLVSPESLASIDLSWTVFDGFQGWESFEAARKLHRASELELSRADFTLEETVRQRFYQALGAQILADVAAQNVATLQDHLRKTKDILDRGSATKFDLLRVQVQLEEALSDEIGAKDNVILASQNLAVAMGLESDSRPLSGLLPEPDEARLSANLKPDFSSRTDLEALKQRAAAAEEIHNASYGAWVPRVTLTAEKQYYDNTDYDLWGNFRDAYALGVQFSWNLFDGGATLSRNFQTHYQGEQAEAASASAALRAPLDFETYKRRYLYNAALFRAKRRSVEMARESVRLAQLGYNAGTRTSSDVLDAELDLIRARAGVVRAQVDGADSLVSLELAVGSRIEVTR